ncbi:MAG: UDP-3-O-[3-hydroxymyristoyl] N-acetylglucosamine deacetylase [Planctomyces sp.]|nr:UDP-3-O-[3-hydroxymyristoyl] N-acetylglucosamine deacetylase [Planctomyces sp.]
MVQQSFSAQKTVAFPSGTQVQTTLSQPATFSGPGLFHGIEATVRLLPAEEHTGIVFQRVDIPDKPVIPARVEYVTSAARRTVLQGPQGGKVETTEHLMAALAGLQIDNCIVEISGPEVPALDGSCLQMCEAILEAGRCRQTATRKIARLREPHGAGGGDGEWIEVTPRYTSVSSICYQLDYGQDSPVPAGAYSVNVTPEEFLAEIAGARTFVLESEIEALRRMGFGKHLTARDLIVFSEDGQVKENRLRWSDEPVRHKILDCIGDLALSGVPFVGQVIARRSGHKLNHVMASTLSMISGRDITGRRAA